MDSKKKLSKKERAKIQKSESPEAALKTHSQKGLLLNWILALVVGVFSFLLYSNTLSHDYTLDDYSLIKENRSTRQGTAALGEIFSTSYRYGYIIQDDEVYRPLSKAMFAIEWEISPDDPSIGHFVNVLCYALTALLLFFTLLKLFKNNAPAFIITLLYMAHPLHTEVVANIKSRDEIMGMIFLLGSTNLLMDWAIKNKTQYLLLAAGLFFLALLSKESSITYAAIAPFVLHFFSKKNKGEIIKATAILLVPALLYLLIRRNILGTDLPAAQSVADNLLVAAPDTLSRFATAVYIMGIYLKLMIWPHPLVFDYSFNQIEVVSAGNILFLISLLAYGFITIYAFIRLKKKDILSFGIWYFILSFSIFSNLVLTIGSSFGERFLYSPTLGFAIVLGWLIYLLSKKDELKPSTQINSFLANNKISLLITLVITIGYSAKTWSRNYVWKDNITLFSTDVKVHDKSTRTHYYLGNLLTKPELVSENDSASRKLLLDSAIAELQRSVDILPSFSDAYTQMGVAYYRLGMRDSALAKYRKSLQYNPYASSVHNNIGTVFFETGQYDQALNAFREAVRLDPRYAEAYANMGSTYGTIGKYQDAINAFQQAIKNDPGYAQAYYFLGITYKTIGDENNGNAFLNKAYELNPSLRR
ncbi:MAG TPA: tetratricopeptide repeat protein [Bacteroidia bacterium]|nr:tetratricopeptide repeat protein [Bacteroidia bacterium]